MRKLGSRITSPDLNMLEVVHKHVWFGLALLWVSGLTLLYARTGLVISEFSPKLFAKLAVVGILTANAVLKGALAMPILRRNVDQSYFEFSFKDKTMLCLMGAISVCSWLSGLILGIFSALKFASFNLLLPIFATLYCAALVAAIAIALTLHMVWRCRVNQKHTRSFRFEEIPLPVSTTIIGKTKTRIIVPDNSIDMNNGKPA